MRIPAPFTSIPQYLEALKSAVHEFSFLHTQHAVNFIIDDYWNSAVFPSEWRILKETCTLEDLLHLAAHGTMKPEWPESFRRFVDITRTLPLNRSPDSFAKSLDLKLIPNVIRNGMSPKKQHEVANLASLINAVASKQGIERIMDIGAGQGYLDISLAFQYGKTVIGVDDDEIQTCGAKRRTDIVNSYVQRRASDGVGKLLHVNRRVHKNETFASLLDDVSGSQDSHWLLCGLHSCGDLTPAVMKHFLESEATALVVVGCCYNKLTEKKPSEPHLHENVGFPLSSYLLSQSPRFHLGFSARTLACQATCRWTEPDDGGAENFKKHHYRALLQFVLHQHGLMERARNNSKPSPDHDIIIGRLKPNAFSSGFASYAKLALSRLHIDADAEGLAHEILQRYDDRYKGRELEIAIVWTLRSMMGDIFESLLLADRFLFLTEQLQDDGSLVQLVPLFEPIISPRNMALIAVKAK